MPSLPPRPANAAAPDSADIAEKQALFRALHGASPCVRRALVLVANGKSIEEAARGVGCHPRFLRRRLEAMARPHRLNQ